MSPEFTIGIHGVPTEAIAYPKTAGLTLEMSDRLTSSVTIYCGDEVLARDLAAAINGVLEQHRAKRPRILEAAE